MYRVDDAETRTVWRHDRKAPISIRRSPAREDIAAVSRPAEVRRMFDDTMRVRSIAVRDIEVPSDCSTHDECDLGAIGRRRRRDSKDAAIGERSAAAVSDARAKDTPRTLSRRIEVDPGTVR